MKLLYFLLLDKKINEQEKDRISKGH